MKGTVEEDSYFLNYSKHTHADGPASQEITVTTSTLIED